MIQLFRILVFENLSFGQRATKFFNISANRQQYVHKPCICNMLAVTVGSDTGVLHCVTALQSVATANPCK